MEARCLQDHWSLICLFFFFFTRYEKLKKTTDAEAERPSMEELIARRRAAAMGAESRPLADHSLLPAR